MATIKNSSMAIIKHGSMAIIKLNSMAILQNSIMAIPEVINSNKATMQGLTLKISLILKESTITSNNLTMGVLDVRQDTPEDSARLMEKFVQSAMEETTYQESASRKKKEKSKL
uniref:Uncharacterized protein n=1 Tax=Cacopsylla melanoneura TaxID=428564 RepID=A0A8D8YHC8_9HEMI